MVFRQPLKPPFLDPLPEFGAGDYCELTDRDELSQESLVGWPEGMTGEKLVGARGMRETVRAVLPPMSSPPWGQANG